MQSYESRIGTQINHLKIIKIIDNHNGKRNRPFYEVLCICGLTVTRRADSIIRGGVKSCGCLTKEMSRQGHILPNNQAAINKFYKSYKGGAKKRRLEFNLSIKDFEILIFKNCHYCGTKPLTSKMKRSKTEYYTLIRNGIDRTDSKEGYSIDNCVPCCPQCNYAKSDLSLEKFKIWIAQITLFNSKKEILL